MKKILYLFIGLALGFSLSSPAAQAVEGILAQRCTSPILFNGAPVEIEAYTINGHHILVNGKKVNIPSYRLRVGDVVSVAENSRKSERMKNFIESMQKLSAPKWLELNANDAAAKVVALPVRDDIEQSFNEQLIVELYSK